MKYLKNTELAKIYHVSEKSIRNWIEAAENGKLDLTLHNHNGKNHIANNTKNTVLIEKLVEKGKKFRNKRGFKEVTPKPKFYKTFNQKQILDIISNLTIHREIPTRYSYSDGGAEFWDEYAIRLADEGTSNILTQTIDLLNLSLANVDILLKDYKRVDVVDLGPGNGLPIKDLLAHLLKQGKLKRYIAIDCSKEMLDILEKNIKEWFGSKVAFEGHIRDFSCERFDDLLSEDYSEDKGNLICLLGGTPSNFRSPSYAMQTVNDSMGLNDILVYTGYLDTPNTRRYFDFNTAPRSNQKLRSEITVQLLGVDEQLYSVEQTFEETQRARCGGIIPKVDMTIKIELDGKTRHVELRKNERILVWRYWHKNDLEIINMMHETGFDVAQVTKSPDSQYILVLSRIKTGN